MALFTWLTLPYWYSPTDVQFSVSDTHSLTESEWPSELRGYFEALQSLFVDALSPLFCR